MKRSKLAVACDLQSLALGSEHCSQTHQLHALIASNWHAKLPVLAASIVSVFCQ